MNPSAFPKGRREKDLWSGKEMNPAGMEMQTIQWNRGKEEKTVWNPIPDGNGIATATVGAGGRNWQGPRMDSAAYSNWI